MTSAALLLPMSEHSLPEWLGELLFERQERVLEKASGHKYIRRVPTGKARPRYRYYYKATGGKHLGHEDEMQEGASFRVKHEGKEGHFHVTASDGNSVTVRHDETGHEAEMSKAALRALLHKEHAELVQSARSKAKERLAKLETLNKPNRNRAKRHADEVHAAFGGVHAEPEKPKPEKKTEKSKKIGAGNQVGMDPVKPSPDPNSRHGIMMQSRKAQIKDLASQELVDLSSLRDDGSKDLAIARNEAIKVAREELAAIEASKKTLPDGREVFEWDLPTRKLADLQDQIKSLQKKTKRVGAKDDVGVELVGKPFRKDFEFHRDGKDYKIPLEVQKVRVWGDEAQVKGWSMVGTVDHLGKSNVLNASPGMVVPEEFRDAKSVCHHCKTNRKRSKTVVFRNDDGEYIQVGMSCLSDFAGSRDADSLASRAKMLGELSAIMETIGEVSDGIRGDKEGGQWRVKDYMEPAVVVHHSLEQLKSQPYNNWTVGSIHQVASRENLDRLSEKEKSNAADVLSWIKKQDPKSQYWNNVRSVIDEPDGLQTKHMKILVSAVHSYRKAKGLSASARSYESSKHVGEIGKRLKGVIVNHEQTRQFESEFGLRYLHRFKTKDGNVLHWWTGGDLEDRYKSGDIAIDATVKKHGKDSLKGHEVTDLSRVRVLQKSMMAARCWLGRRERRLWAMR